VYVPAGAARPPDVKNALTSLWAAVGANGLLTLIFLISVGVVSLGGGAVVAVYVVELLLVLGCGVLQAMTALKLSRGDTSLLERAQLASAITAGVLTLLLIASIAVAGGVYVVGLLIALLVIGANVTAWVMLGRARKTLGI
jgi:hypothetical protein